VTKEAVAAIAFPSLVLHGTEDKAVRPEWGAELAATLPNAELITYDDAAHNYLVAYPDKANSDVLDFVGKVDADLKVVQPSA